MVINRYTLTTAESDACNSLEGITGYSDQDVAFIQTPNHYYRFFAANTAAPNGVTVFAPDDITPPAPGRWFRQGPPGVKISLPSAFACQTTLTPTLQSARWIKPAGLETTGSPTAVDFPGAVLTLTGLIPGQQLVGELLGSGFTTSGGTGLPSLFQILADFGSGDVILATDLADTPDPAGFFVYRRVAAAGVLEVPVGATSVTTRVVWSCAGDNSGTLNVGDRDKNSLEMKLMMFAAGSVIET